MGKGLIDLPHAFAECVLALSSPSLRARIWLLVSTLVAGGAAFSQDAAPDKALSPLPKGWDVTMTRAEKSLLRPDVSDESLDQIRETLDALQQGARKASEQTRPEIASLKEELKQLGSPPAADAPPEPGRVAERRKAVADRLAAAEGLIKEAELLNARAEQVLGQVSSLKRIRFTERIIARGLSPLSPAVWRQAWPEFTTDLRAAADGLTGWLHSDDFQARAQSKGWMIPAGVLTAILLAWPLRLWLLRRFGYIALDGEPTYRQRLRAALFTGIVRSLLPSAAVIALYLSLQESELMSAPVAAVAWVGVLSLTAVFFATAFCWAALGPTASSWRLVPISDHAARAISRTVTALAAVFALDWVLTAMDEQVGASVELTTVRQFLIGLAIAGLLFALLRKRIWQRAEGESGAPAGARKVLRAFLAVLVCAIPLTACFGYVALSRMLATQLVQSGGLFVLLVLSSELGGEMIERMLSRDSHSALNVRDTLVLTDEGSNAVGFWLKVGLSFGLILIGLVALPLIWGVRADAVAAALTKLLTGFQVGPIRISLASLFWAVLLFTALLVVTRLVQRTLEHQIFPRTRLDSGLRHSVRAGVGYAGFTLAVVLAISSLGLDLSNLAIIAGALSVGAGLGLQNIVNNFVSGVILLVERPIKVGDWVVIGDQQGYVRKISVRSTELSTFDRGSVFIPNSNLLANPLMNRTHADPQGRVIVPIGVAYGSDTARVRQVLLDIAHRHAETLRNPAPLVLFRAFGDSALQFELVAFIADVTRSLTVTSDLCFAIDEAFRREEIQIPYPQREVAVSLQPEQIERLLAAWSAGRPESMPPGEASATPSDVKPASRAPESPGGA